MGERSMEQQTLLLEKHNYFSTLNHQSIGIWNSDKKDSTFYMWAWAWYRFLQWKGYYKVLKKIYVSGDNG